MSPAHRALTAIDVPLTVLPLDAGLIAQATYDGRRAAVTEGA